MHLTQHKLALSRVKGPFGAVRIAMIEVNVVAMSTKVGLGLLMRASIEPAIVVTGIKATSVSATSVARLSGIPGTTSKAAPMAYSTKLRMAF